VRDPVRAGQARCACQFAGKAASGDGQRRHQRLRFTSSSRSTRRRARLRVAAARSPSMQGPRSCRLGAHDSPEPIMRSESPPGRPHPASGTGGCAYEAGGRTGNCERILPLAASAAA
jgi:hypothetical protein